MARGLHVCRCTRKCCAHAPTHPQTCTPPGPPNPDGPPARHGFPGACQESGRPLEAGESVDVIVSGRLGRLFRFRAPSPKPCGPCQHRHWPPRAPHPVHFSVGQGFETVDRRIPPHLASRSNGCPARLRTQPLCPPQPIRAPIRRMGIVGRHPNRSHWPAPTIPPPHIGFRCGHRDRNHGNHPNRWGKSCVSGYTVYQ